MSGKKLAIMVRLGVLASCFTAWLIGAGGVCFAANLGFNGDTVDGMVMGVWGQGCGGAGGKPANQLTSYCGDADGCMLRLVSDTEKDGRSSTSPVTFTLNSTGTEWSVSGLFSGWPSAQGKLDTVDTLLLQSKGASEAVHCEVWERDDGTEIVFWVEKNCDTSKVGTGTVMCALRIDD